MNIKSCLVAASIGLAVFINFMPEIQAGEMSAQKSARVKLQDSDKKQHHRMKHKFKKMVKRLALTDIQKEAAVNIFNEAKLARTSNKALMSSFREQLEVLLSAPILDEKAVTELYSQHQPYFAEAALQKMKTKHAFYQILTKEQQAKLKNAKKGRKGLLL